MDIANKLDKNDFVIRVRPTRQKGNGRWSGTADITVVTSELNDLDDKEWGELMEFCRMMWASVPIIEEVENFRNLLHDYLRRSYDKNEDVFLDKEQDSNIIHLKFMNGNKNDEEKDWLNKPPTTLQER